MVEKSCDERMQAWAVAGTPGEPHRRLGGLVGTWSVAIRIWGEGPDGPVSESEGTVETRWLIPGLWLQEEVKKAETMGRPFHGIGVTGYDNLKRKYVGSWLDSTSTALLTMEGNLNSDGTTLMLFGTANDPVTGEHDRLMGYLTHFVDEDRHRFEIRDYAQRPEGVRMLEIAYTRKR